MVQYTNNVRITMNPTKTEVLINFSQDVITAENQRKTEPIADLVMTGELAQRMVQNLLILFSVNPHPAANPGQAKPTQGTDSPKSE